MVTTNGKTKDIIDSIIVDVIIIERQQFQEDIQNEEIYTSITATRKQRIESAKAVMTRKIIAVHDVADQRIQTAEDTIGATSHHQ